MEQLQRIVAKLRRAWPDVRIIVRGDSGFCREPIMRWCEQNRVDYLLGLAKNQRLLKILGQERHDAQVLFEQSQTASRVYKDFIYTTKKIWSCPRRVVGKAEHLAKGSNPRFVVTSLSDGGRWSAKLLYEDLYCARGEMENRIKEQQLYLFADRTSTHHFRSNQLRVLFSTMAYALHIALRKFGLKGTALAEAQVSTIRNQLLKIGGRIQVSVRRIVLSLSQAYPYQELFQQILANLKHPDWMPLRV